MQFFFVLNGVFNVGENASMFFVKHSAVFTELNWMQTRQINTHKKKIKLKECQQKAYMMHTHHRIRNSIKSSCIQWKSFAWKTKQPRLWWDNLLNSHQIISSEHYVIFMMIWCAIVDVTKFPSHFLSHTFSMVQHIICEANLKQFTLFQC